jgi:1-acyl-sn-glycerol-3-phosphate acyltransferase
LLYYIFELLALSDTFIVYIFHSLSYWLAPLLLLGFFIAINVLYLIILYIISLFLSMEKPFIKNSRFCRFTVTVTLDWLLHMLHIHIDVSGLEKLPDGPFVLVSNHRSNFDPIVTFIAFKKYPLSYISKPENFKIPIAGRFIHRIGFLAIERENPVEAMKTLYKAVEIIKEQGLCFGIYPEGTRSKTGELGNFNRGAFLAAQKAKTPIVIMSTRNTEQIGKNIPFKRSCVFLDILDVIDRDAVVSSGTKDLSSRARARIEEQLKQASRNSRKIRSDLI